MYNHAHDVLTETGLNGTRSQIGNFFTSLEMSGASLTVMRLDDAPAGDDGTHHGLRGPQGRRTGQHELKGRVS